MSERVLFNRQGKAVYRLCDNVLYDYMGKPRGFVAGRAIYDLRGQHRGFWQNHAVWDRMCRVVGYAREAKIEGLVLPTIEFAPVPYKNLPAPETPAGMVDMECPAFVPKWSMMQLESLLPT